MDFNYWVAPVGSDGLWTTDTNWSLGAHPNQGQDVVFDGARSNVNCTLPANTVVPALDSLTFGNWTGVLTAKSDITATIITLNARTQMAMGDLALWPGVTVNATLDLEFNGGSVQGDSTSKLLAEGTIDVNGSRAADKPTLAAPLQVGDGTAATTMTLLSGSQPLVVSGSGNITVMAKAKMVINSSPLGGNNTATAISAGDSQTHTLTLNGGELDRTNSSECYVGMGVKLTDQFADLEVSKDPNNGDVGPLHITGANSDGYGLDVYDGAVVVDAGLSVDDGAGITEGLVDVDTDVTLTLGTGPFSPTSGLLGGEILLLGTLEAHGGIFLLGGKLATVGSTTSTITVDASNQVWLDGAEIDVTKNGNAPNADAVGQLTINGYFNASAGKVVDNVNSGSPSGWPHGLLQVNGNVNLAANVIFSSKDINGNPPAVIPPWHLFSWTGTRTGAWSVDLPNGWTTEWDDANGNFWVNEP